MPGNVRVMSSLSGRSVPFANSDPRPTSRVILVHPEGFSVLRIHRVFLLLALCGSWFAGVAKAQDNKPLEFRLLLLVKAKGDIRMDGFPEVKYEMSKADIAAAKTAFAQYTPAFVKLLSRGRVVWKTDTVISATPLTKVAKLGDGAWVSPDCVQEDLDKYAPLGKYDGVIVYWKAKDDRTKRDLKGGFGWTLGAGDGHGGVGYSCVNYVPPRDLGRESEWTEVFLHEWLHQVEAFYGARGVKLPRGGLHGNDNYGFKHRNGWMHWYEAFINADLTEQDGTRVGLGEAAWRQGTFRDEQVIRLPEYLTPERRRANLLRNGSFEDGMKNWTLRSWRGNRKASSMDMDQVKFGKASVLLRSSTADDMMLWQKVTVKPRTRYLLSGWVRTENVTIEQKGGSMGASLSIWGGYEASQSQIGTKDWTYQTLIFGSGDRTEIEVGARLGHHNSTAAGTAWFDDLALIEIPEPGTKTRP